MQKLSINGFLGIKSATIEVSLVTIIIGEQATGKSIIARLIYFFNEYFANFDEIALSDNEHKSSYDKKKKEEFFQIFPPYSWEKDSFTISFEIDDHEVTISSNKNSSKIELKTSKGVAEYFRSLKRKFAEFSRQNEEEPFAKTRTLRLFRRLQDTDRSLRYESPLFVPAARSFYATIRDEIFSILSIDNKIDRIILQFGEFYEGAKYRPSYLTARGSEPPTIRREKRYFEEVVKGQFVREDGRDWLEMTRGRVELAKASSGQQEATPLLFAISRYPRAGRTLIIEEPEAHLFPTAQVRVLEFILEQAVRRNTYMVFTTHSPYLLSATNNHLMRSKTNLPRSIDPKLVRAYSISSGRSSSLVDEETDLISADYIDSISEKIAVEFEEALEASIENE